MALFELRFGVFLGARQEENSRMLDVMLADGVEIVPFNADDARNAGEICAWLRRTGSDIGPMTY